MEGGTVNIEIDKLVAGPELDALVAEKVMGFKVGPISPSRLQEKCVDLEMWSPSTDIAAAWEVVEKLQNILEERRKPPSWPIARIEMTWDHAIGWKVFIPSYANEDGDALPATICRAALKAIALEE